jgi:purine-nucleoside phosphorylase
MTNTDNPRQPMTNHATFVDACRASPPALVVILGSGMGGVAARVRPIASIPFAQVPGLPTASVPGHKGWVTLGEWAGLSVLLFEGRLHRYEGHSWDVVVRPIRWAAEVGVRHALLTNAAGGIRADLQPGNLMAIADHIDSTRPCWWRHRVPGPGQPSPYSAALLALLMQAAASAGVVLARGTYGAVTGPCYETPAEIRALRTFGADAVGMSTAREVQAGAEAGLLCAAVSCITNRAAGLSGTALNHGEVLANAAAQSERLGDLLEAAVRELARQDADGTFSTGRTPQNPS